MMQKSKIDVILTMGSIFVASFASVKLNLFQIKNLNFNELNEFNEYFDVIF